MAIIKNLRTSCRDRCLGWAASATSMCLVVVTGLVVYWGLLYYYIHPIDKMLEPVWVSNSPDGAKSAFVYAGESIYFNWHIYIHHSCPVEFIQTILNTRTRFVTQLEGHKGLAPETGDVRFKTMIRIPSDLLPDLYEYHVKGIFACNPLQSKEVSYPLVKFRVLRARNN